MVIAGRTRGGRVRGRGGASRGTRKLAVRRIALRQSASPVSRAVSSSTTARNLRRRPSDFAAPPDTKRLAASRKDTKMIGVIEREGLRIWCCVLPCAGFSCRFVSGGGPFRVPRRRRTSHRPSPSLGIPWRQRMGTRPHLPSHGGGGLAQMVQQAFVARRGGDFVAEAAEVASDSDCRRPPPFRHVFAVRLLRISAGRQSGIGCGCALNP